MAAVLFCHGIFGYAHEEVGGGPESHGTYANHMAPMEKYHPSSAQDESSPNHHDTAAGGYFAVLASMLLGAILWSLHRRFQMPFTPATRRDTGWSARPVLPHPPRGPTLYLLQVIRL